MHINELPAEILHGVLRYLSTPDLAAVQRICRAFYGITEPILYREVDFLVPPIMSGPSGHTGVKSMLNLERTLLRRPELGRYIRRMTVARDGEEGFTGYGNADTAVNLILLVCKRLEYLELYSYLAALFSAAKRLPPIENLQGLKRLDFVKDGSGRDYYYPRNIVSMFFLPQIEFIQIQLWEGPCFKITDWDGLNATKLIELHLKKSKMSEQALIRILSGTPNLRRLEIELTKQISWHELSKRPRSERYINCALLTKALTGFGNNGGVQKIETLIEHLTVCVEFHILSGFGPLPGGLGWVVGDYEDQDMEWGMKESIGSLKCLERLQSLEISLIVLCGWHEKVVSLSELLPTSLKTLSIRLDGLDLPTWQWITGPSTVDKILDKYAEDVPNRSLEQVYIITGCSREEYYSGSKPEYFYPTKFLLGWSLDVLFT